MLHLLLALAAASATPDTVFGIEFGQPLTLPTCATGQFDLFPPETCQDPIAMNVGQHQEINVRFSSADLPPFAKDGALHVMMIAGKAAGFMVETAGIQDQNIVLRRLTDKYGKPAAQEVTKVQNMMGASFDSVSAVWKMRDITATLLGTTTNLTNGRLTIDNAAATTIRTTPKPPVGRPL